MAKIKVVNLYKHNIIYKDIPKIKRKQNIMSLGVFGLLMLGCLMGRYSNFLGLNNFYNTVTTVMNPIQELYNDNVDIVFAGTDSVSAKDLKIIIPVKCEKYEIKNGTLNMTVGDNIMLMAPESGVVEEIGTLFGGGKYIKLRLANNFYCIVENLDILGTKENEIVKKGQDIATLVKGEVVKMSLYENGQKLNNINVNKNIIEWVL